MTEDPPPAVKLFGTTEPPAAVRRLAAGRLTAILEAGALRRIALGGREAVRGIAFVVRDRNWGTCAPQIADLAVEEAGDAFRVTYRARCADGGQALAYRVAIEGTADGRLEFRADGAAETGFVTNRTGFTVLHPIEGIAGEPAHVLHTDGTEERTFLPALIAPSQPVFDIRAITHEAAPGLSVRVTMEGDAYEMEDQRNWTDASFKTYIRPLSKPRPYTLKAGASFAQRIAVESEGAAPPASGAADGTVTVSLGTPSDAARVPELALAVEPADAADALAVAEALRKAAVRRLVCRFDPSEGHTADDIAAFASLARVTGARLTLEAVLALRDARGEPTADACVLSRDVAALRHAAEAGGATFDIVSPSPWAYLRSYKPDGAWPDVPPLGAIYAAVREAFPDARIAGGMHASFTELNRCWPPVETIDVITHTTAAIVHAADDTSVMETLQALPAIFATVRARAGGLAYLVGPSAIGMRFNPYGAATAANPDNRRVAMARADPRQRGLFNASWSLGYIARAAAAGVDGVCLGAPVGPFGVMHRAARTAAPWYDEAGDAAFYPAYHVVRGLAGLAGAPAGRAASADPSRVAALAPEGDEGPALWLANLTGEDVVVVVEGGSPFVAVERLDRETFAVCARKADGLATTRAPLAGTRLALGPYALARLVT